jgi:hypothetical protein
MMVEKGQAEKGLGGVLRFSWLVLPAPGVLRLVSFAGEEDFEVEV